jgi:transcriptional regulator with XRE-family HTH domain
MENGVRKIVGNRIRVLRNERRLTQEELADRSKINAKFLGSVERGEKNLTLQTLAKIADGLRMSLEELFPLPHTGGNLLIGEIAELLPELCTESS